jgi:hypothetical protein
MKVLKPWMLNVVTVAVVGLFFVAQGVGARPGAEPAEPLAPAQTLISYQGTLTDPGGKPINATLPMEFALYDAATDGNLLWGPEMQSVEVSDGLFHVLLGSVTTMDPDALSGDLYLDIKVNGETLTPRELLTSVAYAVEVSDVVAPNPNNELATVRLNWRNDVARIRVGGNGAGAGNGLDIQTIGNTSLLRIDGGGNATVAGSLKLKSGQEIVWSDSGQIRSCDNNHRIVFDRSHNELELREYGTIGFYAGGSSGGDADLVVSDSQIDVKGNSVVNCGALTEANLQSKEELAAERIDRFEEGDVLCWAGEQLEKCTVANDRLIQAVANGEGRPIIIGAEVVKVLGPVRYGDLLVASDVPGYAMVNNDPRAGAVIAQALEDFDGEQGIIKAMIRKF